MLRVSRLESSRQRQRQRPHRLFRSGTLCQEREFTPTPFSSNRAPDGDCLCWQSSPLTTLTTSGDIEGAASFLFMDTDYYLFHRVLRRIASWGAYSFFTEVRVIGGENVPANGPIIVYVYLLDP